MATCSARAALVGLALAILASASAGFAAPPVTPKGFGTEGVQHLGAPLSAAAQDRKDHALANLAVRAGLYGGRIVVADPALASSKQLAPAIEDLRRYLGEITSAEFTLAGSGTGPAIALSLAGSKQAPADVTKKLAGKGLEPFLIRGGSGRLDIVANDVQGLSHGIYYYLEQLGVRWLLPTDRWTVVPRRGDIRLDIDRLVEPAFKVRSYAGTGGFYAWIWGRNYTVSAVIEAQTEAWQRRLRYGGEYQLGKDVGGAFIQDRAVTPILAWHPEYLAKVGGAWSPLYLPGGDGKPILNDTAKVNAGNPAAVALFCGWVLDRFRETQKSPNRSDHAVASVEPSDGYGYGDNISELPGDGSGSDQTFYIANVCARTIRSVYPDASVVLLAYAGHAAPPSFPLEPNVIVQLTPYAFQDMAPDRFIQLWRTKAARLTLYDYWSIPDWENDEPTFKYLALGDKLRYWRANNIEGLNAESTYGVGAVGLGHYLAAHLMWAPDSDERALLADWYDKAFGPAKEPMKRMLERWATSFLLTSAELGTSYRDVSEALALAANDAAAVARVADYGRYLHYLRLRYELEASADVAARPQLAVALAEYLLDINGTPMVDATRMIDLYNRRFPAIATDFALKDSASPGPGWARVHALSDRKVGALITEGAARYPLPDFEPKRYSDRLVPLQAKAWTAPEGDPWGPIMPVVGGLEALVRIPPDLEALPLRITRQVDLEIEVIDARGQTVFTNAVAPVPESGGQWEELSIKLAPGAYRIAFRPAGGRAQGYFSFQTWKGVPLVFETFLSPKTGPSPRLYFYVPPGLRHVVMYYPLGDFGGVFGFRVLEPDGTPAHITYRDNRRTVLVEVQPGEDGKIWSLEHSVSPNEPHLMLNAPQVFALEPGALMVPADAR
jgi:Domain of unknown function (DUF4838)